MKKWFLTFCITTSIFAANPKTSLHLDAKYFLHQNQQNPKVHVLIPNKLQYQITTPGQGEPLQESQTPLMKYKAYFLNGEEISPWTEESEKVALNETIEGFQKGVLGMQQGEKRTLYIHPDLGYTKKHPFHDHLIIFEVELVRLDYTTPAVFFQHPDELSLPYMNEEKIR